MAIALGLNACLPGADAIGVWAPIGLVLVRLACGFAVGGEYSGILVFLLESATDRNRGLVSSWAPAVAGAGSLLAVGVSAAVAGLLTTDQLDNWGWRIPVAFGALLGLAVFLARRTLTETPSFEALRESGGTSRAPLHDVLRHGRRALVVAFGLSAVGSAAYYLNVTYVPTYLSAFESVDSATALRWSTLATAVMLATTPAFGALSDRVGRRAVLAVLAVALAVATPLLFAALSTEVAVSVTAACALAVLAGGWSAVSASAIPEQFPAAIRFTGIAVGYNIAVAVFGGFTPLVATWLVDTTSPEVMAIVVVSVVAVVALALVRWMPERAGRPLP